MRKKEKMNQIHQPQDWNEVKKLSPKEILEVGLFDGEREIEEHFYKHG